MRAPQATVVYLSGENVWALQSPLVALWRAGGCIQSDARLRQAKPQSQKWFDVWWPILPATTKFSERKINWRAARESQKCFSSVGATAYEILLYFSPICRPITKRCARFVEMRIIYSIFLRKVTSFSLSREQWQWYWFLCSFSFCFGARFFLALR